MQGEWEPHGRLEEVHPEVNVHGGKRQCEETVVAWMTSVRNERRSGDALGDGERERERERERR
jgi:hypothetical protein